MFNLSLLDDVRHVEIIGDRPLEADKMDEFYSEYVIWGYPPGGDHTLLRSVDYDGINPITDQETAEKLKAWCEKQGATRCSIQHVTSERRPDFTKVFN